MCTRVRVKRGLTNSVVKARDAVGADGQHPDAERACSVPHRRGAGALGKGDIGVLRERSIAQRLGDSASSVSELQLDGRETREGLNPVLLRPPGTVRRLLQESGCAQRLKDLASVSRPRSRRSRRKPRSGLPFSDVEQHRDMLRIVQRDRPPPASWH